MPRRASPDLIKPWKVNLPAVLAGKIEYLLLDPVHQKPIYAARNYLLKRLLLIWLKSIEHNQLNLQARVQEFLDRQITEDELRQALLADMTHLQRLPTLDEVRDARS